MYTHVVCFQIYNKLLLEQEQGTGLILTFWTLHYFRVITGRLTDEMLHNLIFHVSNVTACIVV